MPSLPAMRLVVCGFSGIARRIRIGDIARHKVEPGLRGIAAQRCTYGRTQTIAKSSLKNADQKDQP